MDGIENRTMDKVIRRLVPFLTVCYFMDYLDRVNVGFAGPSLRPRSRLRPRSHHLRLRCLALPHRHPPHRSRMPSPS